MAEEAKVATRNVRRDTLDALKKMKTAKEITEDEYADFEKEVNDATAKATDQIDKLQSEKEKEVMTV